MKTLIFGAGNLLLSDEGFGVHCIRYLEKNYSFPKSVELYDGGTLGIMVTHKFEEAEQIYILDVIEGEGTPGELRRYEKDDIMLDRITVKLSPHQIGIQETLLMSELRGFCPSKVTLLGVLPVSLDASDQLSVTVRNRLEDVAGIIIADLAKQKITVKKRRLNVRNRNAGDGHNPGDSIDCGWPRQTTANWSGSGERPEKLQESCHGRTDKAL